MKKPRRRKKSWLSAERERARGIGTELRRLSRLSEDQARAYVARSRRWDQP
jgi:hypothetical protein